MNGTVVPSASEREATISSAASIFASVFAIQSLRSRMNSWPWRSAVRPGSVSTTPSVPTVMRMFLARVERRSE